MLLLVDLVAGQLQACDLSDLGVAELERVVARIRRLQGVVASLLAAAVGRAAQLAEAGVGPGADGLAAGSGDVSPATARADARRGDAVRALPCVGRGLAAGRFGVDHVDVVAGVWSRSTEAERAALAELDGDLAEAAGRLSVGSFERRVHRIMARIRQRPGSDVSGPERSELRWWWGRDGAGRISGRLTAEQYERMASALGAEMDDLIRRVNQSAEVTEAGQAPLARDGHLAAEAFMNRVTGGGAGRTGRPALTIVVDAATVAGGFHEGGTCEAESGGPLSMAALERCACDAHVRTVTLDGRGVPTDVGRLQRTATDGQWAALKAIYCSCAWYGCDRPVGWCEAHHVVFWENLGPTDLANLVPLCSRHHHLVHEGGWRLELTADRELRHVRPDGEPWRTSHPDRFSPDTRSPVSGTGGQAASSSNETPGHAETLAA